MKTTITIILIALLVWACHRKTIASDDIIISNKSSETKNRIPKVDASNSFTQGEKIYANSCGRCHGLKKTKKYTSQEWENILKTMIPKAKLNDEEAKQVTAYVMEHSKK